MLDVTNSPPAEVLADLAQMRLALDDDENGGVPAKKLDRNLLIATWNIRAFGDLTERWESAEEDSPKRDLHSLLCIAEIVSRFDVVAVQEAKDNLKALRHLIHALGPNWGLSLTDVTEGAPGDAERMAFLFDTRRVQLSGLACEIVVPQEQLGPIEPGALQRQFARTPYAVSFRSGGKTFILITLHVLYGEDEEERLPEIKAIAQWLAEWARDINSWDHNLIALGDFNIDRKGDALHDAFVSTGLEIPDDLQDVPRTIFSDPQKPELSKFYDQIAWFTGRNGLPALSLQYTEGGYFDFTKAALTSRGLTKVDLSWRISDHYPLWVEFSMRDQPLPRAKRFGRHRANLRELFDAAEQESGPRRLCYSFGSYEQHERFYQDVAAEAGLEPWEIDRFLYNHQDEFFAARRAGRVERPTDPGDEFVGREGKPMTHESPKEVAKDHRLSATDLIAPSGLLRAFDILEETIDAEVRDELAHFAGNKVKRTSANLMRQIRIDEGYLIYAPLTSEIDFGCYVGYGMCNADGYPRIRVGLYDHPGAAGRGGAIVAIKRVALVADWEDDLDDPANWPEVWRETRFVNFLPEEDHVAVVKFYFFESMRQLREELTDFKKEHWDLPWEGN